MLSFMATILIKRTRWYRMWFLAQTHVLIDLKHTASSVDERGDACFAYPVWGQDVESIRFVISNDISYFPY